MKARIQIPAGWRRLRAGEFIANGDRYYTADKCFFDASTSNAEWRAWEHYIGAPFDPCWGISIRRVKRRAKAQWNPKGYEPLAYTKWLAMPLPGDDESLAYSIVGERKLIPYSKIMFQRSRKVRFWLRRGAK